VTEPERENASRSEVGDNQRELRYELALGREVVGELRYRLEPGVIVLVHTDIEPRFEGQGLASKLIRGALDDVRQRGLKVTPLCPFVRSFIDRHPEYNDLVVADPASASE
jgi:uncharacterized protein